MGTTTIRVDTDTHRTLLELAAESNSSLVETTRAAAEALWRQRFAGRVAEKLDALRADPAACRAHLDCRWRLPTSCRSSTPVIRTPANRHHRTLVIGPRDTFGTDFPFVIPFPLTTTGAALSLHVEVDPSESNRSTTSADVKCKLLRSVNRRLLVHQLGSGVTETISQVDRIRPPLSPGTAAFRLLAAVGAAHRIDSAW